MEAEPVVAASVARGAGGVVCEEALAAAFEGGGRKARSVIGDLDDEDEAENQLSIKQGFRILSAYTIAGERVWIITEADRSATTLMFASEY